MLKEIKDILNKQLLRHKPTDTQFGEFLEALRNLKDSIQPNETEEHNKDYVKEFLRAAFYGNDHLVNTAGNIDCAIYQTKETNSPIEVIIETKAPSNKTEFPSIHNLNCRAMQELVLYFMRQRFKDNNFSLKHLIMTNGWEWFIIDATEFEKHFADDKKFVKLYKEFDNNELLFSGTKNFYTEIAKPKIDKVKQDIVFAYVDIRTLSSDTAKLRFYRIMQPAHLLKSIKFTDTNKLNTAFYNELLYIIGLEEHKVEGKNVIERKPQGQRNTYSLIESTIYELMDYGVGEEKEQFDIALNLVITWINRILFLKLLESQLISFHGNRHADEYRFLSSRFIKNYDELNELFFKVLAFPIQKRPEQVKEKFRNIPYLNSSLFEMTENEEKYFPISGLKSGPITFFSRTVLKDNNGHHMQMEMSTLDYLFHFLDAYDFGSELSDDITQADNKTLINASVLGLIFEKINGYKDGSYFTPAFITQYICRETIVTTIIQKFNERFGWNCKTLIDIHNQEFDKQDALDILDNITICDPAVGSGHFLVSALNRLIAIRAELGLLRDESGKRLKDYNFSIDNDELIITDEDGEIFHYNPNNVESQRVQKTLFDLKRRIIENNLFGVDVNPNSVNICRLRLWIELLKNAYYRDSQDLETLPNIDINIKCGNSLVSRYLVRVGLSGGMNDDVLKKHIQAYKDAVQQYKAISNKEYKKQVSEQIQVIKTKLMNVTSQLNLFDQKQKVDKKEELIRSLNPLEWMLEFPEVLDNEGRFVGFDIIIGNPPYIEAKKLKGQSAALKDHYEVYSGTADLSVYFIELALRLLKPNGHLCYITTNKFFSNEFGKPVRRIILSNSITHLVNFEQVEVFENVLVSSVILGITSHAAKENNFIYQQFFKLNNEQIKNDFEDKQNSFGSFEQSNLDESEWSFATGASAELKRKLDVLPRLGKHEGVHIYRGVTTGYNPAFIITNEQRDKLIAQAPKNAEIIKNMLQGRNIRKWFYNESEENLLFVPWHFPLQDKEIIGASVQAEEALRDLYPSIYEWLLLHKEDLVKRNPEETCIRYEWYALQRCAASYYQEFEKSEKIIWGLTATNWAYTLDTGRHYLPSNGYILTSEILPVRFILGLLNSKVLHQYFKYIGVMTAGGAYTLKAATIEAMPIPDSTPEQRQAIINIVNTILEAKKQDPTTDVAMEEQQIDELVYNLFGITDEEKELIEQS